MEESVLSGVVKKILYKNEENGYTVLIVEGDGTDTIVVGTIPYACAGETIEARGEYKVHKQYGRQFCAESVEVLLPQTATGILDYLSGGAVKGIGEATAKRIVSQFGDETLEIMEHSPERLCEIKGITKAKAGEIGDNFRQLFGIKRSLAELAAVGLEPYVAVRLYKKLGASAPEIVKKNPYILCDEIIDIPFEKADEIAKSLGVSADAECRVAAGVEYVLQHNLSNGHSFLPYEPLVKVTSNLLGVEEDAVEESLQTLMDNGLLQGTEIANISAVYLQKYWMAEKYSCQKLMRLAENVKTGDFEAEVAKLEKSLSIAYAPLQRRAILQSAQNGVFVLTGGPGTGKTTTLVGILALLEQLGMTAVLAAPTGRAAKRMSDVTGREAKTIHRLLEMGYSGSNVLTFQRHEQNPIEADAVIIDETSMVDVLVFEALLRALKPETKLVLVGDADQLPPVGAGNVLKDIIGSGLFATIELKEIFRQAKDSLIVVNAHTINGGEYPECSSISSDFFFVKRQEKAQIVDTVVALVTKSLPKKFGLSPMTDIQVIAPTRKGETGIAVLNEALQAAMNPPAGEKKEMRYREYTFRENDRIMQVKNNYDITWLREDTGEIGVGLFNGDIGIIKKVDPYARSILAVFDDRAAELDEACLEDIEPAYAITVHKSQGNEFPCVVMPVWYGTDKLCTRNLLYTAVTRAKSLMVMVGAQEAVYKMVDNNVESRRFSGLKYLLTQGTESGGSV